jgi:hypothetical protein
LFLMHIHKRRYVLHHLGHSPHDWHTATALPQGRQIFRTAAFIHSFLKTTQNYLLFFGFKPISTVHARIAVEYTKTCGCQYCHNESILSLSLLTDRTQRNLGVQSESSCTSWMCGIYLLALYTQRYLPVSLLVYLSTYILTYLLTYLLINYLITYITRWPFMHLPTYRSIYLSVYLSIYLSICLSIRLSHSTELSR